MCTAKKAWFQYRDGARFLQCVVEDEPVLIGGRDGDIGVPGATVSRRLARVFRSEGRVWIEDLRGDGVSVNGARVDRAPLAQRDLVQVAGLELQFWEE